MASSQTPVVLRPPSATNAIAGAAGGVVSVLLGEYDVSIQFSVFHGAKHLLEGWKTAGGSFQQAQEQCTLSYLDYYLAGGAAGIANSIVSGPVEHIRIRLQMQQGMGKNRLYNGPWDCMTKIYNTAGSKGIFKGQNIAVLREFQAYGCYFLTFETCMRLLSDAQGKTREHLPPWLIAPCGAMAGVAFWVGSYPLDVIKTLIQNDGFGRERTYKNAWMVAVHIWRQGKLPAFFRGLGPTLLRTMLSSSGTFTMWVYFSAHHIKKLTSYSG
ncbi:hypothetical protein H2204_002448 [Knufia peltigerae]|uniref:Mitochondrial carrier protein n=1 Tax=Knufia peltigerae TaxID=1002370 RepID=A0AA38YD19_9EURO|nr:hypothetical protein H2204_002448 [Knufia peltigerae]